MQMVPIKEMVEVLRVVRDIPQLRPRMYVRLKRTMYKDDLAQVPYTETTVAMVSASAD